MQNRRVSNVRVFQDANHYDQITLSATITRVVTHPDVRQIRTEHRGISLLQTQFVRCRIANDKSTGAGDCCCHRFDIWPYRNRSEILAKERTTKTQHVVACAAPTDDLHLGTRDFAKAGRHRRLNRRFCCAGSNSTTGICFSIVVKTQRITDIPGMSANKDALAFCDTGDSVSHLVYRGIHANQASRNIPKGCHVGCAKCSLEGNSKARCGTSGVRGIYHYRYVPGSDIAH